MKCGHCGHPISLQELPDEMRFYPVEVIAQALFVKVATAARVLNRLDHAGQVGPKVGHGQYPRQRRMLSSADTAVLTRALIRPFLTKSQQEARKAVKLAKRAEAVQAAPIVKLDEPVQDKGVTADWRDRFEEAQS